MGLIVCIVFVGAFAVVALLMYAAGGGASHEAKRVYEALDSALASDDDSEDRNKDVNLRKSEMISSIPWLNRKLRELDLAPVLHSLLYQADLKWNAGTLVASSVLCFALPAYLTYLRFDSFIMALPTGLLLGSAPLAYVLHKRSKRLDSFQQGLPEALDLMVSALRAGHSLIAAVGSVARECADPVGCEFKTCFEEQNYGLELKNALDNLIKRVPLQDLRIFATAIMIQKESGGNLAEVLDKTAHVIRERFRLKRQVGVHTAQGRMTGWVLTFLPVALGILLYFVNPEMMSVLWKNPTGIKMLWTASGMMVVGGLIIHHIVNMDV
ncbi:MAG: type II secretion system F family protein [Terracidiphilus sp.]|jgi:tight adherence protein B